MKIKKKFFYKSTRTLKNKNNKKLFNICIKLKIIKNNLKNK